MEITNKTLAFIVFFTILLSAFSTVTTLNRISKIQRLSFPSGKAATDIGIVQLTVSSTVSIILLNDTVNFGSGYVNDSCPVTSINNATLIAGAFYNDSGDKDCWIAAETPTALHIENDGNQNVLLKILGPTNQSFFTLGGTTPYPGSNPYSIEFRARNYEANACDDNGAIQSAWIDFAGTNRTICSNFTYAPTRDQMAIDVKVVIPRDLPAGTYQNSTITFMAATS